MNHRIRVIKRGDRKEPQVDRVAQPSTHPTREITTTINLWVNEYKERRGADEDRARTGLKQILATLRIEKSDHGHPKERRLAGGTSKTQLAT